ncbi:translation initiation inhibitor [Mycobacterium sp. NS-7484]|uniref:RidA family protein n=1 Tax=unclassified Mycobacterium TaxID=2642494 RepID=UPI0007FFA8D5|nr:MULTISPECIES: RidA family protein [unclassified Mycobacterium]OBG81315.1 translation initiation inhibitor [Mycobacterium sp. E802]OMC03848.1 translation initiation inhibitor [Mycobacterium sp. NS-7484]
MSARKRLAALGIELPAPAQPKGAYFPSRRCGDQLWISGTTARRPEDPGAVGVVGADVTAEQASAQARWAALNLVAAVDAAVGLDAVTALVHLRGYVRATSEFDAHPGVIDGASALLLEVFGQECGAHARTAIGVASLPGGACVELELVAAVRD